MDKVKVSIKIIEKDYNDTQKHLIEIFKRRTLNVIEDKNFEDIFIILTKDSPKNPRSDNRRILGFGCKCISCLGDGREVVRISLKNFMFIMAKVGIQFELTEPETGKKRVTANDTRCVS